MIITVSSFSSKKTAFQVQKIIDAVVGYEMYINSYNKILLDKKDAAWPKITHILYIVLVTLSIFTY